MGKKCPKMSDLRITFGDACFLPSNISFLQPSKNAKNISSNILHENLRYFWGRDPESSDSHLTSTK